MKILFYILILFNCIACIPDPLPLDVEQAPTKLVISSQYLPDVGLMVLISKSFSALEERNVEQGNGEIDQFAVLQDLLVTNAEVFLINDSRRVRMENLTNGFYALDLTNLNGSQNLSLEVYDPETGISISASTEILPSVEIRDIEYSLAYEGSDSERVLTINYQIDDPVGDNWYLLNFYSEVLEIPNYRRGYTQFEWLSSESELIPNGNPNVGSVTLREWTRDTLGVALFNVTPEHYRYLEALSKSESAIPFVSEPLNVTGNIKDGYGFFEVAFPDIEIIEISE